jgi:hypothetical protein
MKPLKEIIMKELLFTLFCLVSFTGFTSTIPEDIPLNEGDLIKVTTEDRGDILFYCEKLESQIDITTIDRVKKMYFDESKSITSSSDKNFSITCQESSMHKTRRIDEYHANKTSICKTHDYYTRGFGYHRWKVEGIVFSDKEDANKYLNKLRIAGVCQPSTFW